MTERKRKKPLGLPHFASSVAWREPAPSSLASLAASSASVASSAALAAKPARLRRVSVFNVETQFHPFFRKVFVPLVAEFVGLFFLTFVGAAQQVSFASPVQHMNRTASAISSDSLDLDAIAGRSASPVVVGITLAILINSLVHLSGANLNPTASIAFLTIGDLPWQLFVPYLLAQILGSTLGAAVVRRGMGHVSMSLQTNDLFSLLRSNLNESTLSFRALMPSAKYKLGGGMLLTKGDPVKAFGVEVIICFFMMFVAFTSSVDQPSNAVFAYTIGFTVTVSLYAFGPVTGACMNPARSMGAILAAYGFDFGAETSTLMADAWNSTGIYFAGDLLGGFLAGVAYRLIAKNRNYAISWKKMVRRERFCNTMGEGQD